MPTATTNSATSSSSHKANVSRDVGIGVGVFLAGVSVVCIAVWAYLRRRKSVVSRSKGPRVDMIADGDPFTPPKREHITVFSFVTIIEPPLSTVEQSLGTSATEFDASTSSLHFIEPFRMLPTRPGRVRAIPAEKLPVEDKGVSEYTDNYSASGGSSYFYSATATDATPYTNYYSETLPSYSMGMGSSTVRGERPRSRHFWIGPNPKGTRWN